MASDYYWLAAFVPTVIKHLLRLLDFIKVGSTFYNALFVAEVLSIIFFFILVGVSIGRFIAKEKENAILSFRLRTKKKDRVNPVLLLLLLVNVRLA